MGFLAKLGGWIDTNLPTITNVVKKVANFVTAAADLVEAHMEGRSILVDEPPTKKSPSNTDNPERPDFLSSPGKSNQQFEELCAELDENKKRLSTVSEENELEHRRMSLQVDVVELIISAQTFERFTNNINIHASNLNIHLQSIRNQIGMLDNINRQRVAIKALMKTVNHLINVTKTSDKVEKIEGIDIDIKQGAVSIADSYKAFEDTRDLLINEINSFSDAIEQQFHRVERVRGASRKVPSMTKQMSKWLEGAVEPSLRNALDNAKALKSDLEMIPKLESELRNELQALKLTDDQI